MKSFDRTLAHAAALVHGLRNLETYSKEFVKRPLRPYQLEPARAILKAVDRGKGGSFSVMMARQAGKNELSAQLEGYLLTLNAGPGGSIVKCAPTFRPQVITSMERLREVLDNPLTEVAPFEGHHGYILSLKKAKAFFLSADTSARVVGATASLLLEFDEAQEIDCDKHDRDFVPMSAAYDAVRVYYGTAWQGEDLLQRVKAEHLALEKKDKVRRHFEYPWSVIAEHNPTYAQFVEKERARLGATHPVFLSQYELKPVAREDALLDEMQMRLLQGDHPRRAAAEPDRLYVAGVDVAGPAELVPDPSGSPRREHDSTVVTICEVSWEGPAGAEERVARVVHLVEWTGKSHVAQHHDLLRLFEEWRCRVVGFDATGLGQGPAQFLRERLGERLEPVAFSGQKKSQLGFDLLSAVNRGGAKMYAGSPEDEMARRFWAQLRAVRRVMQGEGLMGWAAPRGHDDYAASLALAVHAAGMCGAEPCGVVVDVGRAYEDGRY